MRENRMEGKGRQKGKKDGMYERRRGENDREEGDEKGNSEEWSGEGAQERKKSGRVKDRKR